MKKTFRMMWILLFCCCTTPGFASCSFKVINHSAVTFLTLKTKGTINNLLIPVCVQNPQIADDPLTRKNCMTAADNILFEHPYHDSTCEMTEGWKVVLQFETSSTICMSQRQSTIDKNVVLNYPADFNCHEFP